MPLSRTPGHMTTMPVSHAATPSVRRPGARPPGAAHLYGMPVTQTAVGGAQMPGVGMVPKQRF